MNKLFKTTIILVLALLGANTSFSQSLVWEKVTGFSSRPDYCEASALLGKRRYVFAGYQELPQQSYKRVPFLIFTNTNGDTLFTRRYHQFNEGFISGVKTDKDSTIIVAGNYVDLASNSALVFAFKTDYNGNIIWNKNFR